MKAKHFGRNHLKKELTLFDAVVYGVGLIIGAGIYALIGKGAGLSGNSLWLSFVIGGFVALCSGLSYAELSSAFPKAAAEYTYVKHASRSHMLSFIVGWLSVFAAVMAVSTVAIGFAGYFNSLTGFQAIPAAVALIALCAAADLSGTKISTRLIVAVTALEILGLFFIIALGLAHIGKFGAGDYFSMPFGIDGVFSAAALMFFAYIGFEGIANMSEDTGNARKIVPVAVIASIIITTAVYILISLSVVSAASYTELSQSKAPMSFAAAALSKDLAVDIPSDFIISVIAILATSSTALIGTMVASRILYGMQADEAIPKIFGEVNGKTGTPDKSVAAVAAFSILFALLGDIEKLANMTNFSIFAIFLAVNLALISLRLERGFAPKFRVPLSIRNIPITAILGALSSLWLLMRYGYEFATYGTFLVLSGIIFFMANAAPPKSDKLKQTQRRT